MEENTNKSQNLYLTEVNAGISERFESLSKKEQATDQSLLREVLQSPESANSIFATKWLNANDGKSLSKLRDAVNWVINNKELTDEEKLSILKNTRNISYKKYISPEDFFKPGVMYTQDTLNYIYPNVKDWFLQLWSLNSNYRNLILYSATRCGKSHASTLMSIYLGMLNAGLRNTSDYYNISPASVVAVAFISYNLKKAQELLADVFELYLGNSLIFERLKYMDQMVKAEQVASTSESINQFYWTTAKKQTDYYIQGSRSNAGTSYKLASSMSAFLGLTLQASIMSELGFSGEDNSGWSGEYIDNLYSKVVARVNGSFHGNRNSFTIIDSSPNNLANILDKKIWNGDYERLDPETKVIKGSQWYFHPEWPEFQEYTEDPTKSFKVYVGESGKPPKILEKNEESQYDPTKIIDIPNTIRSDFERNVGEAIKDRAGVPIGSESNLIQDYTIIEDMFSTNLKNIFYGIEAPNTSVPEGLIFSQIQKDFFKQTLNGLEYWYKPWIPRVIGIDQSYAHDTTGISMCHCELNNTGELIYIIDFTVTIIPNKDAEINLDAIEQFIEDLKYKGHISIAACVFDQFQSKTSMQKLERKGFNIIYNSVDRENGPYLNFIQLMNLRRIKCGKNIFLKNNLKSLYMQHIKHGKTERQKINHREDKPQVISSNDMKWETSTIGTFGKDTSDSACNCIDVLTQMKNSNQITDIFSEQEVSKALGNSKELDRSINEVLAARGLKFDRNKW